MIVLVENNKENTILELKDIARKTSYVLYPELIEKVMNYSFLFDIVGVQPMRAPVSKINTNHPKESSTTSIFGYVDDDTYVFLECLSNKLHYCTNTDDVKNGDIILDGVALSIADEIDISVINTIYENSSDISTVDLIDIENEIYRVFNSDYLHTSDTTNKWIVVSNDVFAELSTSPLFQYEGARCQDFQLVGILDDIKVYVNNLLPNKSSVLMGYKQDDVLDGFIFCPYMICEHSIINPYSFVEYVAYMFRSGYFDREKFSTENNKYYGKIVIK